MFCSLIFFSSEFIRPQKTGSSTIQSTLDKLSQLSNELKLDNLYYRHVMPEAGDFDCAINAWGGFHNCTVSETLKALMQQVNDEGKDLLLTDENLNQNFAGALRDAIDDDDWDIMVIVMYRRIHEWLLSWYNQINKTTNLDSNGNILFDENGIPYRTEHKDWPDQNGRHIPEFTVWYKEFTQAWDPSDFVNKHRSIEYYNLYRKSFHNVRLHNMHREGGGDIVTDFCHIIGANNTCTEYQNNIALYQEEINSSVNLDHDIIAVHAYQNGLINKALTRKDVTTAVTSYIRESGKVVPRKCDRIVIDQIRNWLVDSEKNIVFEDKMSDNNEKQLLQIYELYVNKGKLCDMDKEAILVDQDWLDFFHSLEVKERQKRNIVLHVGPIGGDSIYKTLTTTPHVVAGLKHDNYTVANIHTRGNYFFECVPPRGSEELDCVASSHLKSLLLSLEENDENVLIANDNFDERYIRVFKEAIDETAWNLKVVVGYIRFNHLLLMMYKKEYHQKSSDPNISSLMGIEDNERDKDKYYSNWPDKGGIRIPGFNEWYAAFVHESGGQIPTMEHLHLRDNYISSFEDVVFHPYHGQIESGRDFICKLVPDATMTCDSIKKYNTTEDRDKESLLSTEYTDGDIIAVKAYDQGLIKEGLSRQYVSDAVRNHLRTTGKVLARVCVSNVTKQLYDWMIESEKSMLGRRWSAKKIAEINDDFQLFIESGKLCAIDIEKELREEMWLHFFASLG